MRISCDKAEEICTKSQYEEASWWQMLKLKFHVFYCKNCTKYSAKNTKFTTLCEAADMKSLDTSDKEAMKDALKKKF